MQADVKSNSATLEKLFKRLNTPQKIQDYLDTLSFNFEKDGETCFSPALVAIEKKAHCFEGALFACAALLYHNEKPLLVSLSVEKEDWPHALTIFKQNGYWGAISKTNHIVLRYRDPIYKTIRELVLSYFHEYYLTKNGKKTLLSYSKPINLKTFGTDWITSQKPLFYMSEKILTAKHTPFMPTANKKFLRKATPYERNLASIPEWKS